MRSFNTNNKGQSLIEFMFCISFGVGIIFMFINFALNTAVGYIAHYATYMAARTYLVSDNYAASSRNAPYKDAEDKAKIAFDYVIKSLFKTTGASNYLMKTAGPATVEIRGIQEDNGVAFRRKKVFVGAVFKFAQRLPLPTLGVSTKEVNLVSEAFLGKEPTRAECMGRIRKIIQESIGYDAVEESTETLRHATLFDDGC
ncbi:MAG: hypothetical protein HQK53_16645 [Oligoflexia bacterium]|nr:hypothetical protein [Oligoflexia bacterium]